MTRLHFIFSVSVLLFSFALPARAYTDIQTSAKQAFVMDFETGATLYAKNADERMPTSSMSKVMSMYVVFDAINKGEISLADTFTVSEKAWKKGGSKMFIEVGKDVKVEDLVRGVIVQSGNDAAIALAEGLAGSERAFARRLNDTASDLDMTNSHFANASGWPDPEHYSTARDLALMAKALVKNFPDYYHYYSEQEFTYNNIKQTNRNPLLYRNMGADGIKTGHTEDGGYGLIGSGTRFGRRAIVVVNGLADEKARAQESARLLDWALDEFKNQTILKAGESQGDVPVLMGKARSVSAVLQDDVFATVPEGRADDIQVTLHPESNIEAPLQKGQEIGSVEILIPGQEPIVRTAYAASSVERLGFFSAAIAKTRMFLEEQFEKKFGDNAE